MLRPNLVDPPPLPPGAGAPSVSLLVNGLVRAGHHVTVWTLDPRIDAPVRASGPGLDLWCGPQATAHRGRRLHVDERRALARGMQGADVEVLNAHWTYEYAWAGLARPEPLLVSARDWPPAILRLQPSPYRALRMLVAARVLAARPTLSAPSEYLAKRYRALGLPTTVIPNGITAESVVPAPRSRGTGMHVLSVASGFDGRKNTTALLRANEVLRAKGTPVRLQLVGAGHGEGEEAARWARAEGLDGGVEFTGRLPFREVQALMRTADVLVHPSKEESYGRVLVEAMAQGLPVIGGRRSGAVPWVLDGGRAGHLVDVRRPEVIAAAITKVLTDGAHWEQLSRLGRVRAVDAFTMEPIVEQYVQCYQDVIAAGHRR